MGDNNVDRFLDLLFDKRNRRKLFLPDQPVHVNGTSSWSAIGIERDLVPSLDRVGTRIRDFVFTEKSAEFADTWKDIGCLVARLLSKCDGQTTWISYCSPTPTIDRRIPTSFSFSEKTVRHLDCVDSEWMQIPFFLPIPDIPRHHECLSGLFDADVIYKLVLREISTNTQTTIVPATSQWHTTIYSRPIVNETNTIFPLNGERHSGKEDACYITVTCLPREWYQRTANVSVRVSLGTGELTSIAFFEEELAVAGIEAEHAIEAHISALRSEGSRT